MADDERDDPHEQQEHELEKLDEADERDEDTEYEREVRPGGDSTPQRPPQAD
jgi:hypothetical protein